MIKVEKREIIIKKGDITKEETQGIVNAANGSLIHGGGVAASIVRAGGEEIQKESYEIIKKQGNIPTGNAVITHGYNLPCKYVIHVVGPRMGEGDESAKLKKAVLSVLNLSEEYKLSSISMPAISSGIFGFPKEKCAKILINTTLEFLKNKAINLNKVVMCNFDELTYNIFLKEEKKYNS